MKETVFEAKLAKIGLAGSPFGFGVFNGKQSIAIVSNSEKDLIRYVKSAYNQEVSPLHSGLLEFSTEENHKFQSFKFYTVIYFNK